MKKKEYITPSMMVVRVQSTNIICTSPVTQVNSNASWKSRARLTPEGKRLFHLHQRRSLNLQKSFLCFC